MLIQLNIRKRNLVPFLSTVVLEFHPPLRVILDFFRRICDPLDSSSPAVVAAAAEGAFIFEAASSSFSPGFRMLNRLLACNFVAACARRASAAAARLPELEAAGFISSTGLPFFGVPAPRCGAETLRLGVPLGRGAACPGCRRVREGVVPRGAGTNSARGPKPSSALSLLRRAKRGVSPSFSPLSTRSFEDALLSFEEGPVTSFPLPPKQSSATTKGGIISERRADDGRAVSGAGCTG